MASDARLIADFEAFEDVTEEDRASLAESIDLHQLAAGETLFKTGEPGEALYVVRDGEVELYIKDTAGQKILLAIAGRGDVFGELALLDRGARTPTAMAFAHTDLLELDREDRLLLFHKRPVAAHFIVVDKRLATRAGALTAA